MKHKVALIGAAGRMGAAIIELLRTNSLNCELSAALVLPKDPLFGQIVPGFSDLKYTSSKAEGIKKCDVVIDFSSQQGVEETLPIALEFRKAYLSGVTGLSEKFSDSCQQAAAQIPICLAPNFSIGVIAMKEAVASVAKLLKSEKSDIHILESHHKAKLDAPSGTALALASTIKNAGTTPVITSIRAADLVGEHLVSYYLLGETLEIRHTVKNRAVFGLGALKFASILVDQPPGLYSVLDLLEAA